MLQHLEVLGTGSRTIWSENHCNICTTIVIFVQQKLKTIVIFLQLAFPTKYVCGTGAQISGSGSSHPKLLRLLLRTPAPQPWLEQPSNRFITCSYTYITRR